MLVAIEDKKVVGFISLHLIPLIHENGYLSCVTALVVDESCRKQGVGQALLKKAESYALKNGAVRTEITSGEKRTETHDFYQKNGYQEISKRFIKIL